MLEQRRVSYLYLVRFFVTPSPAYKQTSKSLQYLKYLSSRANNYPLYQNSVTEMVEYEYSVLVIFRAWIVQFVERLCITVSCQCLMTEVGNNNLALCAQEKKTHYKFCVLLTVHPGTTLGK